MRCMFCGELLIPQDKTLGAPVTIPGKGVAHAHCAEKDLHKKRIFGEVHISDLSDEDLLELHELVQTEVNERIE